MQKRLGILAAAVLLAQSTNLPALEVRQDVYEYHSELLQKVSLETFVIGGQPDGKRPGPPAKPRLVLRVNQAQCEMPTVLFALGEAVVTAKERKNLLAGMVRCGVGNADPLIVTGHTCNLGPAAVNERLSVQRAESVAKLLQDAGYNVVRVRGEGFRHMITNDPDELHLNRRVEIQKEQGE